MHLFINSIHSIILKHSNAAAVVHEPKDVKAFKLTVLAYYIGAKDQRNPSLNIKELL